MDTVIDELPKVWNIDPEPKVIKSPSCGGVAFRHEWELPVDQDFLVMFLTDVFENHWDGLRYGPLIQGAAYEIMCVAPPSRVTVQDGYLTIFFSKGGHFHLCVGDNFGPSFARTSDEMRSHRKPARAIMYRGTLKDGSPVTWGFEMWNGKNEPMISIFFPNPFVTDEDGLEPEPVWPRLGTWRIISKKYLGLEPQALDMQASGLKGM
ncbi:MAG: hypothetical protein ABL893_00975 [Hyphomicrobium sp.]|nr:hypothetical protein [Hyphomicrobium sp.]